MHSEREAKAKIMKFTALVAGMALLAGCAVAVPLRPQPMSSQAASGCTGNAKCPSARATDRVTAQRRSQPSAPGKIYDDPPDFIANSGADQGGDLR